ncbi:hypothetical protein FBQ81_09585 [Chloroflexi bacterium CFX6]|nr:hypothetical protein [Chloroflexi bacterium CFX6]
MKRNLFLLMLVAALALSACASPTGISPTQLSSSDQATTVVPAATMQALPTNMPEPTCPEPVEGTKLLIREAVGYCLLYPEGYIEIETHPTTVCLVPEGPTMGCHNTNLIIEVEDAGGRTVGEIADEIVADAQAEIPGIEIRRTNLSMGGEEAVVLEGLAGVASSRNVLLVHEDRRYELIFVPWDEHDENFAKLNLLYNTVVNSFTLLSIGPVTVQALPTFTPKPSPTACQVPTFKASDAGSDCFNDSGEPIPCAGLDLLSVEAGMVAPFESSKPIPTGFILTFAESPETVQEFTLYLYLDLDENPETGLDMSVDGSALPGIDRLFGIALPSGDAWTQVVAKGPDAEIIRGPEQVAVTRVRGVVTVMVGRGLLVDKSAKAAGPSLNLPVGGALPDAFTMYIATTRGETLFDVFDNGQEILSPQAMTVPKEALYPVCVGGS